MYEIIKQAHDAKVLEARIVEWGRWMRAGSNCTIGNGPNLIYCLMREAGTVKSSPAPLISDEEAEMIGMAVTALRRSDGKLGDAIVKYYVERAHSNLQTLGRDLGCSRPQAGILINQAMQWLQGYFCGMLQRAA